MTTKEQQEQVNRLFSTMAVLLDIRQAPDCPAITAAAVRTALQQALAETAGGPGVMIVWSEADGTLKVNLGGVR